MMTIQKPSLPITRRTTLAGLGAGSLGLALAGRGTRVVSQTPDASLETNDVVYGTVAGVDLLLDVARPPERSDPRPAVVLVHGGGLTAMGRYEMSGSARGLAEAGYVTFNIDYRLFSALDGTNPWPAQLDDAQRAVRWVRANAATYGVDPDRVGALGWSSGGQLAAFLGTRDTRDNTDPALATFESRVSCVVTLGGIFDMTIPYKNPSDTANDQAVLGGSPDATPDAEAYRDFSPIAFVDQDSAAFLIMQEGSEDVIPYEHSRRMVAALQAAGIQVSYGWFPGFDHGSWGNWASAAPETLAFFERHLNPEQ